MTRQKLARGIAMALSTILLLGGCAHDISSENETQQSFSPYIVTTFDEHSARRVGITEEMNSQEEDDHDEEADGDKAAEDKYAIVVEAKMGHFSIENKCGVTGVVMSRSEVCFLRDGEAFQQELVIADGGGNVSVRKLPELADGIPFQVLCLGRVWGNDRIIGIGERQDNSAYFIFELDEEANLRWSIDCDFLEEEGLTPVTLLRDKEGLVHMDARPMEREDEKVTHYVLNDEGETLEKYELRGTAHGKPCRQDWVFAEDGTLLLRRYVTTEDLHGKTSRGIELYSDTSSLGLGRICVLTYFDKVHSEEAQYVIRNLEYGVVSSSNATPLLYADEKGIWVCTMNLDRQIPLFEWERNDASVQRVLAVEEKEGNRIAALYVDGEGECRYVILESKASGQN